MNWPRAKLDALAADIPHAFVGGPFGSKLTTRDYVESGVPVIRGSNMSGGRYLDTTDLVFVSETKLRKDLSSNVARENDLIFTQRGTLGQVVMIPTTGLFPLYIVSQSQMKLTVDESKADPRFIYYYFSSPTAVGRITNLASSSGVPHINLTVLRNFELPVPPLETQRRIADILSAYDDLIENNRRRIALLEQAARELYREWFVRLRFPGHESTRIVDGVPEGWERVRLSDLVSTQYGYTASASEEPIGPKFLRGTDINKNSYIDWDTVPYCPADNLNVGKYALRPGDLLVVRMADPGKVAIVEKDIQAVFASYLVRMVIHDHSRTPSLYLFYVLTDSEYQGFIGAASGGSTRKSASAKLLTDFRVVQPPGVVQSLFVDHVAPLREMMGTLLDQNAQARASRDILVPRLMSGELAV